ncbi:MAG: insulinase family protein [Bacteroidetes bacterium]|nr:insulinase family protein [Bacteroidota bacterium]
MLNRKTQPAFKKITSIPIQKVKNFKLLNGIDVFTINAGTQSIIKLDFIFDAGMYFQKSLLVAASTNALLESGSENYSANELSENIDYFGSFLELEIDQDRSAVVVYTLNKYLKQTLQYVAEVINKPIFPEDEFQIYKENKKQTYILNSQKVGALARRKFPELIFGEKHPYGIQASEKNYDELSVNEIRSFYNSHYKNKISAIIVSGNLPEDLKPCLNLFFGAYFNNNTKIEDKWVLPKPSSIKKCVIEKDDAIQNAIKIGRLLFNKTHEDYFHFQVLNCVLGGYFDSRLMANIREDKGYTYGIGSAILNLKHAGVFSISAEVGADVCSKAIDEIYKEIKRLREGLIGTKELETVKNYMLGQFLRSAEGPFELAEKFKSVYFFDLNYDYHTKYFNSVKAVKPHQLREMANKYLQQDDLIECVAGKKM